MRGPTRCSVQQHDVHRQTHDTNHRRSGITLEGLLAAVTAAACEMIVCRAIERSSVRWTPTAVVFLKPQRKRAAIRSSRTTRVTATYQRIAKALTAGINETRLRDLLEHLATSESIAPGTIQPTYTAFETRTTPIVSEPLGKFAGFSHLAAQHLFVWLRLAQARAAFVPPSSNTLAEIAVRHRVDTVEHRKHTAKPTGLRPTIWGRSCVTKISFRAQRRHRIGRRGATRRHEARPNGDEQHEDRNGHERRHIDSTDIIEKSRNHPARDDRAAKPDHEADAHWPEPVPENRPRDVRSMRPERETHAE